LEKDVTKFLNIFRNKFSHCFRCFQIPIELQTLCEALLSVVGGFVSADYTAFQVYFCTTYVEIL
jgi:hypothetical protein